MTGHDQTESRSRNPIEAALDLAVFAPLGFALEFRRVVPELAEAGRRQVAFSRSLGQAALRTMARSAGEAAPGRASSRSASSPAPEAGRSAQAGAEAAEPSETAQPSDAVIDGYDGLTAREVIALCNAASTPQLRWMRDREQAAKQRKTVLAAIERAL